MKKIIFVLVFAIILTNVVFSMAAPPAGAEGGNPIVSFLPFILILPILFLL